MAAAVIDGQFFFNAEGVAAGTYAAPDATDILPIEMGNPVFTPAGTTAIQTWMRKRSFNYPQYGVNSDFRFWNVAFTIRVKHATAAGTAPELNQVFEACGFLGTNDPGVSEIYTLVDNPNVLTPLTTTASVVLQELTDGKLWSGSGFKGSLTLRFNAEGLFADVAGIAMYRAPIDTAITSVSDANVNTGTEIVDMAASTPFTLDTGTTDYEPCLHEFTWTQNLALSPLTKINSSNGTGAVAFAQYGPAHTWSALVQADDTTAFDFEGKHLAGTAEPLQAKWTSGSFDTQLDLYRVQYDAPVRQPGNPNLLRIGGNNYGNESNSPITLTFT